MCDWHSTVGPLIKKNENGSSDSISDSSTETTDSGSTETTDGGKSSNMSYSHSLNQLPSSLSHGHLHVCVRACACV